MQAHFRHPAISLNNTTQEGRRNARRHSITISHVFFYNSHCAFHYGVTILFTAMAPHSLRKAAHLQWTSIIRADNKRTTPIQNNWWRQSLGAELELQSTTYGSCFNSADNENASRGACLLRKQKTAQLVLLAFTCGTWKVLGDGGPACTMIQSCSHTSVEDHVRNT